MNVRNYITFLMWKHTQLFGIHLLLNILLVYQIARVSKMEAKEEQTNKDNAILFDEEENVKM